MGGFVRQIYNSLVPYESRLWFYKLRHTKDYQRLRTIVHPSPKGDFSLKPFDENKCIFIHITKTAGTSVAKSLFGYLPYHYTATDYKVIYGKSTFNSYFKFAFVRNPWDRIYSAFRYLKAGGWNDNDKLWAEQNLKEFDTFNTFIANWLTKENIMSHRHFWPQHVFICNSRRQLIIDHLAYFETLNDDFDKICRILNIDATLGLHNVSPGDSYRNAYDEKSRKIVGDVYSADIELFGYDFDGIRVRTVVTGS